MGLSSQICEREDALLCSDVRDKLFGPMEFSRRDLGSLNIMRGRDTGLPDYNTARKAFNLPPKETWHDIAPNLFDRNPGLEQSLIVAYDNRLDNIDAYLGGMLESDGKPGELFQAAILEQFLRLRDSDRFWFENEHNEIFTKEEIAELRKITLWDIIVNSTSIHPGEIQKNIFVFKENDPCPQPFQMNTSALEPCNDLGAYDYFTGSEIGFTYSCVFLAFVPILGVLAGYTVVKFQNSKRRRLKVKQEALR